MKYRAIMDERWMMAEANTIVELQTKALAWQREHHIYSVANRWQGNIDHNYTHDMKELANG